jgi:hypothetical protein
MRYIYHVLSLSCVRYQPTVEWPECGNPDIASYTAFVSLRHIRSEMCMDSRNVHRRLVLCNVARRSSLLVCTTYVVSVQCAERTKCPAVSQLNSSGVCREVSFATVPPVQLPPGLVLSIDCQYNSLHLWSNSAGEATQGQIAFQVVNGTRLQFRSCFIRTYANEAQARAVVAGPDAANSIFGRADAIVEAHNSVILYPDAVCSHDDANACEAM